MQKIKGLPKDSAAAAQATSLLDQLRNLIAAQQWKRAAPISMALANLAPDLGEAHDLMGQVALQTGAPEIAEQCFSRAVSLGPITADKLARWAQAQALNGHHASAESTLLRALVFRPGDAQILCDLGDAQLALNKPVLALKSFTAALKSRPGHSYAAHMAAALSGEGRSSDTYVATLFDNYADYFDAHLTGTLHYRVPEALVALLAKHRQQFDATLDIGCGTGLVGVALGDRTRHIDGIDLAPRMIDKARARGIYRNLISGEAAHTLSSHPDFSGPYDLVVAADVLIYVGALEELLAVMAKALASNGLIAFSVEAASEKDIEVCVSGRFAHGAGYIVRLAAENGLVVIERVDHDIRLEQGKPIAGALYVLART